MDKIIERIKKEFYDTLKNFGVKVKEKPDKIVEQKETYEINLVPDVKRQMIKAMRFRNIFLFVCIVLVSTAGGVMFVLGTVWEGQNIVMSGQDARINAMSDKLRNYDSLSEFLTIQTQLKDIGDINQNKKVLSRIFSILSVILPEGPDTISLSELSMNLSESTLSFDAQADAKISPYIDYRVLESFRKGVSLMKYDYGRYVDEDGNEIPSRCMVEADADGNTLTEIEENGNVTNKYVYAYWMKGNKGCDPQRDDYTTEEDGETEGDELESDSGLNNSTSGNSGSTSSNNSSSLLNSFTINDTNISVGGNSSDDSEDETEEEEKKREEENKKIQQEFDAKIEKMNDYEKELAYQQLNNGTGMKNVEVQKIYRSPRFSEWYKEGYMSDDGNISGIEHFNSECITYSGMSAGSTMKWISNNDCLLSTDEPLIRDSSNGRDSAGNLVLRFNATLSLDPMVFSFANKHVMAISPSGQNVTDSYKQIEGMFAERAADCADSDVVCTTTATRDTTTDVTTNTTTNSTTNATTGGNNGNEQ